jgi:hypothetical protein
VIAKVAVELVPNAAARPVTPDPIGPGDCAPYKPKADVLFVDGACVGPGTRLYVSRGARVLLDKRWTLETDAIDREALRARHAGLAEVMRDARGAVHYPKTFRWNVLQLAPDDQTTEFLDGSEWIAFEGLRPDPSRVSSYLPRVSATARLLGQDSPKHTGAPGRAIPLRLDTIIVDSKERRLVGVLRGSTSIPDVALLGGSNLTLAILRGEAQPQPQRQPQPAARRAPQPSTSPEIPAAKKAASTADVSELASELAPRSTPFRKASRNRPTAQADDADAGADRVTLPPATPRPATPFKVKRPTMPFRVAPPDAPTPLEIPRAQPAKPKTAGKTVALTDLQQAAIAIAAAEATPIVARPPEAVERLRPSPAEVEEPAVITAKAPPTSPMPATPLQSPSGVAAAAAPALPPAWAGGPIGGQGAAKPKLGREFLSLLERIT